MANTANDPKSDTAKRILRTEAYAEKVRKMFAATVNEILSLNKSMPELDEGVMYSFDDAGIRMQNKVETLLRQLSSAVTLAIQQGITLEWELANTECDKLVSSLFGKAALSDPRFNAVTNRNKAAMDAFIDRTEKGMNLSDRIWKSVQQLREEMEVAMTIAIGEGKSASQMSRKVREYLNDPDLMFRRFRYKDESGKWKRKWKKRIKDEATGKYKWIDYDKDDYKTGAGVYKSSAKNAMRVTRTETNMAYRRADHERWQQMDFVLGQRIQLSRNHPKKDICDTLQGIYPKDFVFDGWHPQCFCFVTPVLVDEDEMEKMNEAFLKGEAYSPKGKQIKEYPEEFKEWIKDNADNIAKSRSRGTEPYFIRNNAYAIDEILNPKQKELTTLEKAKLRQEARTPEQIDAINNRWAERQHKHELIKKTADNVLKVASDYGEVDYSKLQQFISAGNLTAMQTEARIVAKQVSAFKKQEIALSDLIPDAHGWHKQFSMADLQIVYDRVKSKLESLSSLTLEEQAKKLQFEIKYVADPSKYKAGAIKYHTWEVSQSAYTKELASVNYKIDYNAQAVILDEIDKWSKVHPKSLKVKTLLDEATSTWSAKGDISAIKAKVAAAKAEMDKRIAEQARRDAKKAAKNNGASFDADAYSKARKDAALWSKKKDKNGLYDKENGDAYFRQFAEKDWQRWNENEKDVAYLYTSGSSYINEPTYTTYYSTKYGLKGEKRDSWKDINTLTKMIDESTPFTRDVWLNRGASTGEFKGQFGISLHDLEFEFDKLRNELYRKKVNALSKSKKIDYAAIERECDKEINDEISKRIQGMIGEQKPFMSTAHSKSWGFVDDGAKASREVVYNIYCPKGTKGIYTEPYSAFGNGGRNWDGKTKAPLENELEVILQRGTKLRLIKAEYKNGQWFIDMEVIEQPIKLPNQP